MTSPLDTYGLPSDVLLWQALFLILISFAVGILGGFVGLALGTVRLPSLLLLGIAPPIAAGTNLIVSTSSALLGSIKHLRDGRVSWHLAMIMGIPSMVGAFIGGFASQRTPNALLLVVVGVLVFWQGVELLQRMLIDRRLHRTDRSVDDAFIKLPVSLTTTKRFTGAIVGLGVGFLGGAVGLILGSLRLPTLIRVMDINPRVASGTNLVIGFAMGSIGWIGHVSHGQVDYPLVVLMSSTAMTGSYLGAQLTGHVDLNRLVGAMGVALLAISMLLIWRGVML